MRNEIETLLSKATSAGEVRAVLQAACAARGPVVRTGVMYSTQERPPRQMTCIVEMEEEVAAAIAADLGAANLGNHLVVFKYDAPDGFEAYLR